MRTLWVCEDGRALQMLANEAGETHSGLEVAHRDIKISREEFDEVAPELGRSLNFAKAPAREKGEVLAGSACVGHRADDLIFQVT